MYNVNQEWTITDLAVVGIMFKIATWITGLVLALLYCKVAAAMLILIYVLHSLISIPLVMYTNKLKLEKG